MMKMPTMERTETISMAYVTPAVVSNAKSETRRHWEKERADKYYDGQQVYLTSGRSFENFRLAIAEILEIYEEYLMVNDTPELQHRVYVAEGFEHIEKDYPVKYLRWATKLWCESPDKPYVIRYKNLKVVDMMQAKFDTPPMRERCRNILLEHLTGRKVGDIDQEEVWW